LKKISFTWPGAASRTALASARVAAWSYSGDCQVIRPAVHWALSVRIGQRSMSMPCSWLEWPGMSPPCSKPASPIGTLPWPVNDFTAASSCAIAAAVAQFASPLPSGSWSQRPAFRSGWT
jgi:hypothetical protein